MWAASTPNPNNKMVLYLELFYLQLKFLEEKHWRYMMKKQTFKQSLIAAVILLLGVTALMGCESDNEQPTEPERETVTASEVPTIVTTEAETEADSGEADVPEGYLFGDANFSMEVADGWTIEELDGVSFILAPNGISNVVVLAEGMHGMSFDDYLNASFDALEDAFPDIEFLMDEDFQVDGRAGVVIVYVSDLIDAYVTYQFFIEVNGVAYIITYTSLGEIDYVDDVADMVDTFVAR